MESNVQIEKIDFFSDHRGVILEPLLELQIARQRNIHVALTEPGCIRGNHYHTRGTEIFAVVGPALIRLKENGAVRDVKLKMGEAFRFVVPPGVTHAMFNPGPGIMLIAAANSLPLDRLNPDHVRDVVLESAAQAQAGWDQDASRV